MAARKGQQQTILRKIFFYRTFAGVDEGGTPIMFDPSQALAQIQTLDWNPRGNYWEDSGRVTCCWIDKLEPHHRLRLGTIRRTDLPQMEELGKLRPLEIPDDAGLAEQTHVVFFPNNIVGADFNFYGPRLGRLSMYLEEKAPDFCPKPFYFEHLLKQDALEQLKRFAQIRMFSLKIRAPFASVVAEANRYLGAAFSAARQASGAEELEITLKPAAYKQDWLHPRLLQITERLLRRKDILDQADHLTINGLDKESGRMVEVDLLSDKLISMRSILRMKGRTRALDANSAYSAIEDSYTKLHEDLEKASGIK